MTSTRNFSFLFSCHSDETKWIPLEQKEKKKTRKTETYLLFLSLHPFLKYIFIIFMEKS
jgi:hypothetical protein